MPAGLLEKLTSFKVNRGHTAYGSVSRRQGCVASFRLEYGGSP